MDELDQIPSLTKSRPTLPTYYLLHSSVPTTYYTQAYLLLTTLMLTCSPSPLVVREAGAD